MDKLVPGSVVEGGVVGVAVGVDVGVEVGAVVGTGVGVGLVGTLQLPLEVANPVPAPAVELTILGTQLAESRE